MSRIAKNPVVIPQGVEIKVDGSNVNVKGTSGAMSLTVHDSVDVKSVDNQIVFSPKDGDASAWAMAGTMRSLVNNMVIGTTKGFEKKLELIGVGYRAQAKGKSLNLTLGFSHPVEFPVPEGITIETPSQTEILVKGGDKQQVGQVAAKIRSFRPPEPYKGKGVRYSDEYVLRKEAKKK